MELNGYTFRNILKRTRRRFALSAGEQALYMELVDICNEEGWRPSFQVSNGELMTALNCTEKTICQWRQSLINAGLLKYSSGKSKRAYGIYDITVNITANNTTNTTTNKGVNITANRSDYNKLNKTKPSFKKEAKYTKVDFKKKLISLGVLEQYADDWIRVRTDKKASFTESAINGIVKECEINNFPFQEAIKICAENSWQGFKYKWIKNKEQNGTHNNTKQSNSNGSGYTTGRNEPYQGGKTSFNQILARKLKATSDSESGNITIDAEVVERR